MRFYLWEYQTGGCDYTIGCGQVLTEIPGVNTMDEAYQKVVNTFEYGEYGEKGFHNVLTSGEAERETAKILMVSDEIELNLGNLRSELDARDKKQKLADKEVAELAELERLQKKYKNRNIEW